MTSIHDLITNLNNEQSLWQRVTIYLQKTHRKTDMNVNECC